MKWRSIFSASPTKFGPGVPLLWRGNSLGTLHGFFRQFFSLKRSSLVQKTDDVFLFESARCAIYNCLLAQGIGHGDEVIVSSFTCEAVTYAVVRAGARVVYVDINDNLSMCENDVFNAMGENTKAVIVQNTFGKSGLSLAALNKLRSQGLFLIADCALAVGSKVDEARLETLGDVSVWSLEVSKTVTIGWGGVVSVNNAECAEALRQRYAQLGHISAVSDIRRLFQLWFSVLMMKLKIPGAVLVWYFMYGTRLFRRSNHFGAQHPSKYEKMGKISVLLFAYMQPKLDEIFQITNRHYKILQAEAESLGLMYPVAELDGEYLVSPRFSLCIAPCDVEDVIRQGAQVGVEVGRWFSECPPRWGLEAANLYASANAEKLAKQMINFPCHWTLTQDELLRIKGLMAYIKSIQ